MENLVKGKDFKKLINRAKKLSAKYLDYSSRKNNKYVGSYTSWWQKNSFWF